MGKQNSSTYFILAGSLYLPNYFSDSCITGNYLLFLLLLTIIIIYVYIKNNLDSFTKFKYSNRFTKLGIYSNTTRKGITTSKSKYRYDNTFVIFQQVFYTMMIFKIILGRSLRKKSLFRRG